MQRSPSRTRAATKAKAQLAAQSASSEGQEGAASAEGETTAMTTLMGRMFDFMRDFQVAQEEESKIRHAEMKELIGQVLPSPSSTPQGGGSPDRSRRTHPPKAPEPNKPTLLGSNITLDQFLSLIHI